VLVSAGGALIDVPAEPRGAALRNVGQDTLLSGTEASDLFKSSAVRPYDIRNVEARGARAGPAHRLPALLRQQVQRARRLAH
jgi:hypothetical protein